MENVDRKASGIGANTPCTWTTLKGRTIKLDLCPFLSLIAYSTPWNPLLSPLGAARCCRERKSSNTRLNHL